jgi:DNA-binding transcriptional ArsR family regulator
MIVLKRNKTKLVEELAGNLDSKFFKSLSEPVRQQLLKFLLLSGRSDIGTIAQNLPQDRSVISRHLQLMQEAGILISEKEGRFVYYRINGQQFLAKLESLVDHIRACIPICCPPGCCGKLSNEKERSGEMSWRLRR